MWTEINDKISEWELHILSKSDEQLLDDINYIKSELPKIKYEKSVLLSRLHKLDQIIAKTKILIDDLEEDYCKSLSSGRTIAEVAEAIKNNFGKEIDDEFGYGEKKIVKFLSEHYNISKQNSHELFHLLESKGILRFELDIPEGLWGNPATYIPLEDDFDITEPIFEYPGKWILNA